MRNAVKLQISETSDVAYAALDAKNFARDLGFSIADQYTIATAVSELAQNIVKYADFGHLSFKTIQQGSDVGIEVLAKDSGPGIENINHAMTDILAPGEQWVLACRAPRDSWTTFTLIALPARVPK